MAGHSRKQYLAVAGVLAVFTLLEIGVVYTGLPRGVIITALVGLAVSKALAVALYYMHLKHETKYLRYVLGLPMLFPPLYAVILMLEAMWHTGLR
jgi:cytochrome c oxidase subunit 4